MVIHVNGEARLVREHATVADLLAGLGHTGRRIAVERNGEIVPRSRHHDTALAADDCVEIVVAVGGG
ncbi:MAG TPA: sulfur carrier protein ThiS [Burkholderiaceae bacterium]|nr:sulfur carrier protein ThiS [Burkholderiaceae bacterium]